MNYSANAYDKAVDVFHRLSMYMVMLSFSAVALAIQTASFGSQQLPNLLELLSWAALIFSGIMGLLQIERMAILIRNEARIAEMARPSSSVANKHEDYGKAWDRRYTLQKWMLVVGITLLGLSRAWDPLLALL